VVDEAEAAEEEEQPVKKNKNKKAAADEAEVEEEEPVQKKKNKKVADEEDAEKEAEEPASKKQKTEKDSAAGGGEEQSFRLFVGGIAFSVDEAQLRKDFEECGEIADLKLLMDKETGNSRGIAFLTMADKKGFDAALKFDGDDYAGRKINVSVATSTGKGKDGKGKGKGKDGKGKGKKGKGPQEKPQGCTSVVVKGLSYEVTQEDLQKCFKACGEGPTNVKILTDRETGNSRGMAFVDFDDTNAVDEAMKLTETNLKGRSFYMDYSTPRE